MNCKDCFIKKAVESYGGKGVTYFNPSQSTVSELRQIIGSLSSDIVIQESVKQCAELSKLNPSSVNTIRFISLLKRDGEVKIYSTITRMGVGNSKVDNATSGGITCGVVASGQLKPVAYSAHGKKYLEHPTTHVLFEDITIPNFGEIIELIKTLHPQVPHFRLVSWDIAIDESNSPVLIEANLSDGEIDFHQLNNGPLFHEDTESILKEVFNK